MPVVVCFFVAIPDVSTKLYLVGKGIFANSSLRKIVFSARVTE